MIVFTGSHSTDAVNLNSLHAFDAVVQASATQSGSVYASLQAALNAGAKTVFVKTGSYVGDVDIVSDYTTIVGEGQGLYSGPAIDGQVACDKNYCNIIGLGVRPTGINQFSGFLADDNADHVKFINCFVDGTTSSDKIAGVCITGTQSIEVSNCRIVKCRMGVYLYGATTGSICSTIDISRNWIWDCESFGIYAGSVGTTTATSKYLRIANNWMLTLSRVEANAGIRTSAGWQSQIIGNTMRGVGASGVVSDGILIDAPTVSPAMNSIVMGNNIHNPTGNGIKISAASNRVNVGLNTVVSSGLADYVNCGSSPGYSLAGSYGTNQGL